jgi:hypothetical protein
MLDTGALSFFGSTELGAMGAGELGAGGAKGRDGSSSRRLFHMGTPSCKNRDYRNHDTAF